MKIHLLRRGVSLFILACKTYETHSFLFSNLMRVEIGIPETNPAPDEGSTLLASAVVEEDAVAGAADDCDEVDEGLAEDAAVVEGEEDEGVEDVDCVADVGDVDVVLDFADEVDVVVFWEVEEVEVEAWEEVEEVEDVEDFDEVVEVVDFWVVEVDEREEVEVVPVFEAEEDDEDAVVDEEAVGAAVGRVTPGPPA